MKRLVLVGNGFDRGHGLNTAFDDFIGYSSYYAEMYDILKDEQNLWSDVEGKFKRLVSEKLGEIGSVVDVAEIVEHIVDARGVDKYGEVSYYDYQSEAFKAEIQAISPIVFLLVSFEADFHEYLRKLYGDHTLKSFCRPFPALQLLFKSATRVVSFNYTNVIELIYNHPHVEHIHGNINDNIVIGCDTFDRLNASAICEDYPSSKLSGKPKDILTEQPKYYEYDMSGSLVEREPIKRFFNEVLLKNRKNEEELYRLLKMKSKDFIPYRERIIQSIASEEYDEVYIVGHSLGPADWRVINAVHASTIVCYYHSEKDRATKEKNILKNGWNISLIPDTEIFK